jgi:hypothetical protein
MIETRQQICQGSSPEGSTLIIRPLGRPELHLVPDIHLYVGDILQRDLCTVLEDKHTALETIGLTHRVFQLVDQLLCRIYPKWKSYSL